MFVGNDIIYINDYNSRNDDWFSRALEKISTKKELSKLEEEPRKLYLKLWSLKESSYKLLLQLGKGKGFYPKKIEVFLLEKDLYKIKYQENTLYSKSILVYESYLFALAVEKQVEFDLVVNFFAKIKVNKQSTDLREAFTEKYKKAVFKKDNDIPELFFDSQKTRSVSLTHDFECGVVSWID